MLSKPAASGGQPALPRLLSDSQLWLFSRHHRTGHPQQGGP